MGKAETDRMMTSLRKQLADAGDIGDIAGLAPEGLAEAISHPKAADAIAELMEIEAGTVEQGAPAPDFTLPWLPGSSGSDAATLTLSEHFGDRPVALIFGSYT